MSYREEIAKIYENEGLKGFTRGYTAMLLRDSPGFALYFCTFEFLKRFFRIPEKEELVKNSEACTSKYCLGVTLAFEKFLCGGTAGCLTWFTCYPFDTIKTKMQTYVGDDRLRFRDAF